LRSVKPWRLSAGWTASARTLAPPTSAIRADPLREHLAELATFRERHAGSCHVSSPQTARRARPGHTNGLVLAMAEVLVLHQRCCDRIRAAWPGFADLRRRHLLQSDRFGRIPERATEEILRTHQSLTIKHDDGTSTKRSPAMAAGIATYPWSLTQLAQLLD